MAVMSCVAQNVWLFLRAVTVSVSPDGDGLCPLIHDVQPHLAGSAGFSVGPSSLLTMAVKSIMGNVFHYVKRKYRRVKVFIYVCCYWCLQDGVGRLV